MLRRILFAAMAGGVVLPALTGPQNEAERGKELFVRRCSGCHALDLNKEGPKLRGVYGRRAASAASFAYSDALKKLSVRWDDTSLNRWLTDPDAMAPDTDMAFRVTDAGERKALIAYLRSLGN